MRDKREFINPVAMTHLAASWIRQVLNNYIAILSSHLPTTVQGIRRDLLPVRLYAPDTDRNTGLQGR